MQAQKGPVEPPRKRPEDDHFQSCPVCGMRMSAVAGSKAAICGNCGYKEGCC